MSEITKLYENAGIKPTYTDECQMADSYYSMAKDLNERGILFDDYMKQECPNKNEVCYETCPYAYNKEFYPPFTAEKQIAIENIIFQCNFGICELQRTMLPEFTKDNKFVKHYFSWWYHAGDIGYYDEITDEPYGDWDVEYSNPNREEALAGFVNALWDEHLTSEEKQQVKGILE